jgi:PAS domain S-box-containing protein
MQRDTLFDSIADGYYQSDRDGNLTLVNRGLSQMLGYNAPEKALAVPQRLLDAENWARVAQRVLNGEAVTAVECLITGADGERRCLEISASMLPDEGESSFHGIVRDLTQTVRGNEDVRLYEALQAELAELRTQYTELSEVEQLKTHMIRVTAHDIRSPLSIISSYIEMLDEDLAQHYNETDQMYVSAIRQAITRIMQLTSDILSLERLREYRDVTLMRVQLAKLLERTMDEFAENSRHRQQKVTLNIEPLAVYGDSVELHEAFANLIGNAVKYTPNGGKIDINLRRDGDFAVLEIIDSGYGIPADQQSQLFQPFHRVKTSETYAIDGTGLGLYLVKKIIERHSGTVHFQSEYGKGSTFGARLPLAK